MLLNTIGRTCPIFFQTLSEKVFPAYAELANAGFDFDQEILSGRSGTSPYERILDTLLDENTEAIQKHLRGLKSKLQNWAAMFHADSAAWLFDAALHTMRGWYLAPDWRNSLRWDLPLSRVITRIPAIAFKVPGWQVQDITFTEYREFVNHHLADYEKKMREQAESHGLIRARRQYSKSNFDWFVLYQLAGWSSKKIADECSSQRLKGLDESTVLKGVKAVADLIGWNELRSKTHNRKTQ